MFFSAWKPAHLGNKDKRGFCFFLPQSIYLCGKPKVMLQRLAKWGETLRNYLQVQFTMVLMFCSSIWAPSQKSVKVNKTDNVRIT
jgi:hypothetical protein